MSYEYDNFSGEGDVDDVSLGEDDSQSPQQSQSQSCMGQFSPDPGPSNCSRLPSLSNQKNMVGQTARSYASYAAPLSKFREFAVNNPKASPSAGPSGRKKGKMKASIAATAEEGDEEPDGKRSASLKFRRFGDGPLVGAHARETTNLAAYRIDGNTQTLQTMILANREQTESVMNTIQGLQARVDSLEKDFRSLVLRGHAPTSSPPVLHTPLPAASSSTPHASQTTPTTTEVFHPTILAPTGPRNPSRSGATVHSRKRPHDSAPADYGRRKRPYTAGQTTSKRNCSPPPRFLSRLSSGPNTFSQGAGPSLLSRVQGRGRHGRERGPNGARVALGKYAWQPWPEVEHQLNVLTRQLATVVPKQLFIDVKEADGITATIAYLAFRSSHDADTFVDAWTLRPQALCPDVTATVAE